MRVNQFYQYYSFFYDLANIRNQFKFQSSKKVKNSRNSQGKMSFRKLVKKEKLARCELLITAINNRFTEDDCKKALVNAVRSYSLANDRQRPFMNLFLDLIFDCLCKDIFCTEEDTVDDFVWKAQKHLLVPLHYCTMLELDGDKSKKDATEEYYAFEELMLNHE